MSAAADVLAGRAAWALAQGDVLAKLAELPDESVNCVVCSPLDADAVEGAAALVDGLAGGDVLVGVREARDHARRPVHVREVPVAGDLGPVALAVGLQRAELERQIGLACLHVQVGADSADHVLGDLIVEACDLAWRRWPGERLFTYVADAKIRSVNPGACFKFAGWRACGRNADGRLTILERLPPASEAAG